jgi:predicted Rossmann-fold nucleotide-binding protein
VRSNDPSTGRAVQVAVCGPRQCTPAEQSAAYRIGKLLAERGAVVICGGGTGVMAAVAAGARAHGGTVIGVRPDAHPTDSPPAGAHPADPPPAGATSDLSAILWTNLGEARNAVIVNSADAVIAVGCSWGTLSEIALAMRRGGVPVVTLGGWQLRDAAGAVIPGPVAVGSPEQAVAAALAPLTTGGDHD